jgi:DNA-binding response OmpR family regulator
MLTARSRPEDVLQGFESGADDYLPKPFNLSILIARVRSLLRRKTWERGAAQSPAKPAARNGASPDTFRFGDKVVDFQNLRLQAGNENVQLTLMESELLRYLIQNAGHPVSRKAILEDVWNLQEDTDTRAIDNFVVRLRKYIEDEPSEPRHLVTVRGLGYKFIPFPEKKTKK